MSKLIIEMEMPIVCADCPICICINGMKPAYCKAVLVDDDNIVDGTMWKETDPNAIPNWCPIKGVLPDEHGDLVDRDELLKTCIYYYINPNKGAVDADSIQDMPAIIVAERREHVTLD